MKKGNIQPYIYLTLFISLLFLVPIRVKERVCELAVASYVCFWKDVSYPFDEDPTKAELLRENHQMREELKAYSGWEEQQKICLKNSEKAIPASIVYRDPTRWTSTCWIRAGEKTNRLLGEKIVAKNSPILIGDTLIGIVKYVGESISKIHLITDQSFVPSVRAVRGEERDQFLAQYISSFFHCMEKRGDLFHSEEERAYFFTTLHKINNNLQKNGEVIELGKGEIYGVNQPMSKSKGQNFHGVGFSNDSSAQIREGDLLVTSGLDGLFPAGLRVGIVTEVVPLREGACSYKIGARSVVPDLNMISQVTVLPPFIESGEDIPFELSR